MHQVVGTDGPYELIMLIIINYNFSASIYYVNGQSTSNSIPLDFLCETFAIHKDHSLEKNSPLDTKQTYSKIKLYAFYILYLHHKNSPLTFDLPQILLKNLHPLSSLLPGSQYGCRLCVGMTALPSFYRENVPLFSHPCSMIP